MNEGNALIENLNNYFNGFWASKGYDIQNEFSKIPTNTFNACMMYTYDNFVNTLEVIGADGHKHYCALDFIFLCDWYVSKCLEFDKISIYGFCLLVNRSMSFLYSVRNSAEYIQNAFVFDICNNYNISYINTYKYNIGNNLEVSLNGDSEELTMHILDTVKKLFENLQYSTVSKLNDTTIGLVTNANNNKDVGLMYAKERIQEQARAKAFISLSDLPKLDEL